LKKLFDFMDIDCKDIDRVFLPRNAFSKPRLTPILGVAIPEGNPFLGMTTSMEKILKKAPKLYR